MGKVELYIQTVERLEKEIHPIDAGAYYASAAISLKRIADSLEIIAESFKPQIHITGKIDIDLPATSLAPHLKDGVTKRCQYVEGGYQCEHAEGHQGHHLCLPF